VKNCDRWGFTRFLRHYGIIAVLAFSGFDGLKAQVFSLGTSEIELHTFAGHSTRITVPISFSRPLIAGEPFYLDYGSGGTSWAHLSLSPRNDSITISATGADSGDVPPILARLRSFNHEETLRITRVNHPAYRDPELVWAADGSRYYALYEDVILAMDPSGQRVLGQGSVPPFVRGPIFGNGKTGPRRFYFSPDNNELCAFFSATRTLARFDPSSLALIDTQSFPDLVDAPQAYGTYLASDQGGVVYFLRYSAARYNVEFPERYYSYNPVIIEVRRRNDGTLLQTMKVPAPPGAFSDISTITGLARHPYRDEVWLYARHAESASPRFYDVGRLIRYRVLPDGTIGETIGTPTLLQKRQFSSTISSYDPLIDWGGFQFTRQRGVALVAGLIVLDDRADAPVVLYVAPNTGQESRYPARLSPDGTVIITGAGVIRRAWNGELVGQMPVLTSTADQFGTFNPRGSDILQIESTYLTSFPVAVSVTDAVLQSASGQIRTPLAGSIVAPLTNLFWNPVPGATAYRVYLSETASALQPATPSSDFILGETAGTNFTLPAQLAAGRVYHWRIDPVVGDRVLRGEIQSFSVSKARIETALPLRVQTFAKVRSREFVVDILTSELDTAWQLVSDSPWLNVRTGGSGNGPRTATLSVDTGTLTVHSDAPVSLKGSLRLVTADGSVAVPVEIAVQSVYSTQIVPVPNTSRLLATLNSQPYLIVLDAEKEEISRCIPLDRPYSKLIVPPGAGPVILARSEVSWEPERHIAELDPVDFAVQRRYSLPLNTTYSTNYPIPKQFVRTPEGQLWVLDDNQRYARFDPVTLTYATPTRQAPEGRNLLSDDGTRLINLSNRMPFSLRSYRLEHDGELTLLASAIVPFDLNVNFWSAKFKISGRFCLVGPGFIFDENLAQVAHVEDDTLKITGDDASVLGASLLYYGPNLAQARILPLKSVAISGTANQKIVTFDDSYGYEDFKFFAFDALPAIKPVTLTTTLVADNYVRIDHESETDRSSYNWIAFSYRRVGESGWNQQFDVLNSSQTDRTSDLNSLLPETAYEIRGRLWRDGPLSGWSEPILIKTHIARPVANIYNWPSAQTVTQGQGIQVGFPATGRELVWTVTGLPEGLRFDPATQSIVGSSKEAGLFEVVVSVSNAGGELKGNTLFLKIYADRVNASFARYTGMLDLEGGPISGIWRATRTGNTVTGTYQAALFSRPFTATFTETSYYEPDTRRASTEVTFDGVKITLTVIWDKIKDRMNLYVSTYNLAARRA
jgi:hypothetical protein